MKKRILTITMASIMVLSAVSFADTPESTGGNAIGIRERFVEKRESKTDVKENHRVGLKKIVEEHAPELLNEFELLWETQKNIHLTQIEEHRNVMEAIKAKVDEGTLTQEEARAEVKALRDAHQAYRDSKFTQEDKEYRKALHDQLKTALDSKDESLIYDTLSEILEALQQHLYNE